MSLGSIPPVERGLARGRRSYRRGTSAGPRAATGFKTPTATSARQQPSQPKLAFPSIQDVKVTRTPNKASWEFPNGEFVVMVGNEEVHVEVRLGGFIDALIVKTGKEE